jgi:hypothetical protein
MPMYLPVAHEDDEDDGLSVELHQTNSNSGLADSVTVHHGREPAVRHILPPSSGI